MEDDLQWKMTSDGRLLHHIKSGISHHLLKKTSKYGKLNISATTDCIFIIAQVEDDLNILRVEYLRNH